MNNLLTLSQKVKVKGQIMHFLVNVSIPKQLDIANQTLQVHRSHAEGTGHHSV